MADLSISTLRGGLNVDDSPHLLRDDQCAVAENVEFWFSALGERRRGCKPFDITGSGLAAEDVIAYLTEWFPVNDIAHPEIWALGVTEGVSTTLAKRSALGTWTIITPEDPIDTGSPQVYGMNTAVLNARQFFAYQSDVDRLHLWDGDTLRRTGLAGPTAAPTGSDEGSGTYEGTRYFRVRFIKQQSSGLIQIRSEPSESLTWIPSGTAAGVTVTRPPLPGESETNWELEASSDGANYYKIAIIAASTPSFNDETDLATTSYADLGPLSEDIGAYLVWPSVKFLTVDSDRLVGAGHWTDLAQKSQVLWSPVQHDPGAGNDERLPLNVNNRIVLDTTDKGEITGISESTNGTWYVFKWEHIYKFTRTNIAIRAYSEYSLSKSHGAIPGSIASGADENGRSCIYFWDPASGPMRIGTFGLQSILGIRAIVDRMNSTATVACRTCYYPDKKQMHWWIAVDSSDTPNLKVVLQVDEIESTANGAERGWSTATGRIAEAYTVSPIHDLTLNESGNQVIVARPFIGLTTPNCVQRCDIGDDDDGYVYHSRVRSKAFSPRGLMDQWGVMCGALMADAHATTFVKISLICDFGRIPTDTQYITTDLAPLGTEPVVIKQFDDLALSEAHTIQVEFSDL